MVATFSHCQQDWLKILILEKIVVLKILDRTRKMFAEKKNCSPNDIILEIFVDHHISSAITKDTIQQNTEMTKLRFIVLTLRSLKDSLGKVSEFLILLTIFMQL